MDVAKGIAKNIPVEHVYGSLGDCFGHSDLEQFGSCEHPGQCRPLVEKIKTYSEQVDSEASGRMATLLKKSSRIVFLGFSFAKINREFLRAISKDQNSVKTITGTAYQMSEQDRESAELWANACFRNSVRGSKFQNVTGAQFFNDNYLSFQ